MGRRETNRRVPRRRTAGTGRRTAAFPAPTTALATLTAVIAVLCTTAAAPDRTPAADSPVGYAFAADARRIEGADSAAGAAHLEPGVTYRSTLPSDGAVHYRLPLDGTSDAYVAVTAVPRAGSTVAAADGVRLSVRDGDGDSCSFDSVTIGAVRSPHPLTAWGRREISPATTRCQGAGTYDIAVERTRTRSSTPDAWDLELVVFREPGTARADGATRAPEVRDSGLPAPPAGEPRRRRGGGGFTGAAPLTPGVWRDDIRPGQTLFFAVPVDWGQRPSATAELGASGDGRGLVPGALRLTLHNPARGPVQDAGAGYDGRRAVATLPPVPPVDHANRHAPAEKTGGMRFAGAYYLVVHLAARVAGDFGTGPFALTLRVGVTGTARSGPGYTGESVPRGVFEVAEGQRAAVGGSGTTGDRSLMTAVAIGGIGTGTLLLAGLGAWTVAARPRAGARAR